ncbi:MAG: UDP-N-acetylmuramoyl-L-alanine--D-glutamate ligase [Treponema sp.]|nr:UDP-N-acetylmuramoyl-L-alanine--D-glutamate ligase [Treponema sp.]
MGCKNIRYILGRHEIEDFRNTDLVIKNPGVRPDSPFLQAAKRIETDISLFLNESPARLFAVTGTKGKSSTAAALHWILNNERIAGKAFLGGNITVSPLSFIDELGANDDVVLELSSFQLGDLKNRKKNDESPLLKPAASVLTAIMPDHLDRYASMEEYIDDKRNIYRGQDRNCVTIAGDDSWGKSFRSETKARPVVYTDYPLAEGQSGGWLEDGRGFARFLEFGFSEEIAEIVPEHILVEGEHQKKNLLAAALAAYSLGVNSEKIRNALTTFRGIEHRIELFHEANNVRFYNDSAATIPEAAASCIEALCSTGASLVLVTGGTDKNLDFSALVKSAEKAKAVILLAGSGSEKLKILLGEADISFSGPFDDLDKAVSAAVEKAASIRTAAGSAIVALSPGCASFGMFLNEFDRGRKWKESVCRLS